MTPDEEQKIRNEIDANNARIDHIEQQGYALELKARELMIESHDLMLQRAALKRENRDLKNSLGDGVDDVRN